MAAEVLWLSGTNIECAPTLFDLLIDESTMGESGASEIEGSTNEDTHESFDPGCGGQGPTTDIPGHRDPELTSLANRRFIEEVADTSKNAQKMVSGAVMSELEDTLIGLLRAHPMNDDALYDAYKTTTSVPRTSQRIRTARSQLVKQSRVKDSGKRAPTNSGGPSRIWEVI